MVPLFWKVFRNLGLVEKSDFQRLLGISIRKIRLRKGLKQEEVAFLAEMARAHYTRLETGVTNPTVSTLLRVSKALGVEVGEFFQFSMPPGDL